MERFKAIPEVHLLLFRENQTLLLLRKNTGYEDGNYSVVAGHPEGNETFTSAMCREAYEEAGIKISPDDLKFVQVMHRKSDHERISFFFTTDKWEGEIINNEPDKCGDLSWFSLEKLPDNIITYIKKAIENYLKKISYSEFNWE